MNFSTPNNAVLQSCSSNALCSWHVAYVAAIHVLYLTEPIHSSIQTSLKKESQPSRVETRENVPKAELAKGGLPAWVTEAQSEGPFFSRVPGFKPWSVGTTIGQGRAQDFRFEYSTFSKVEKLFGHRCMLRSFQCHRPLVSHCKRPSLTAPLGFPTAGWNWEGE